MCNLNHLVFRQGRVLASEHKLDHEDAAQFGTHIKETFAIPVDRLKSGLGEFATTLNATLEFVEPEVEQTAQLYARTKVQVRFPVVEFRWNGRLFSSRTTVTVCIGKKHSKCWTQLMLKDQATELDNVDGEFVEFEQIAAAINEAVVEWYDEQIKSLTKTDRGVHVDFTMNIRSASGDDENFGKYVAKVYEQRPLLDDACVETVAEDVTNTLVKIDADIANLAGEITANEEIRFRKFPISTERPLVRDLNDGQSIVDSMKTASNTEFVNALVAVRYTDDQADFTAVGYDRHFSSENSKVSVSSLANRSIAVEYGGLF